MRFDRYDDWKDCTPYFDATEIDGDHRFCCNSTILENGTAWCDIWEMEINQYEKKHDCGEFILNVCGEIKKECDL